ncbi:MFS general substrate transporter [Delitschia confertaspora ATCC 74209]|uniref:MFS general substrate transporter n=1 Tax=Delitschia confertaspora ATCC 74209 TaxID=1513339 RepID=A0A9P4MU74_9PLEO|nr:MFS general substrate transporter [Delitschia confertaspora ATCC 74209]
MSYSNPAKNDLKNPTQQEAFEEGHDADIPTDIGAYKHPVSTLSHTDLEKGTPPTTSSSTMEPQTQDPVDPDIVDWDGPDDPANPQNWTERKKWSNIGILAIVTLITPLGSSFFAPGVPELMNSFHESSNTLTAFVVSVYILGFAIGPLVIAPMSEMYGRFWIYTICNLLFIVFNVACAVSTNLNMLIVFRFFAGCSGASPLTIGGGTVADMFPPEKRAGAMALWGIGPLLGPVVGPVCGGFLVEAKGWRWVFWIICIFGGFFSILLFVFSDETYHPTLLERKAARLRKETGNPNLRSKLALNIPPREIFKRSLIRPMKMLFFSPIVLLMSIYISINYGILYLLFTTITFVFQVQYRFSAGTVGLSYLGSGIGMMAGMVILGITSDKIIQAQLKKGPVKPEHRLPFILTVPGGVGLPIGLFIYGWCTYYKVHWIVPIIGTVFVGFGNLSSMMTIQTYLVDAFTLHAASAMAANTVLRSLFGAVLPLGGLDMYKVLGLGWGNSLLAFLSLALIPVPILFRVYGERIRTNPRFQVKL